jgi:putative ABC transport system ATP-binding protein
LLTDEPTGELDLRAGDEIFRLLREPKAERGATLLVVAHDRRFIRDDDLVIEFEDGRVTDVLPRPVVESARRGWPGRFPGRGSSLSGTPTAPTDSQDPALG